MIAKNYIRHPEALRFQREMFSNGYHNSPRIMRLMEVIFEWAPSIPQWVKDAKARAKTLVKAWKSHMLEMFETMKTKAKKIDPRQLELVLFPDHEPKGYWMDKPANTPRRPFVELLPNVPTKFKVILHSNGKTPYMKAAGHYRRFCQSCNKWASYSPGPFAYADTL